MKSKKLPGKQVLDITRPKKRPAVAATAPQLVIPKRSIIVQEAELDAPAAEPLNAKQIAKDLMPEDMPVATPATPAPPPEQPAQEPTPQPASQPEIAVADEPQEPIDKPAAEASGGPEEEPKSSKTHPHVRKALEDAKHQEEIQGYIENHEFFVPINAVARKRSLKVTIGLTFLELILGLALLNLMLDAGLIQLLEKIPHTNFFRLN